MQQFQKEECDDVSGHNHGSLRYENLSRILEMSECGVQPDGRNGGNRLVGKSTY